MDEFRPADLNRAKSFQIPAGSPTIEVSEKYKTANASLLNRIKQSTFRRRGRDLESNDSGSKALDDLICLESFEEIHDSEPRIEITPEAIKNSILEKLHSSGSNFDVFSNLDSIFNEGRTVIERNIGFLAAAFLNRYDLIEKFVKFNTDIGYHESKFGFGALHIAAFCNSLEFCDILLKNGELIRSNGVYSPLHCAAIGNHPNIVRTLVRNGGNLEKHMLGGETPLASAVRCRNRSCVEVLLELGADPNAADSCGWTPLHTAVDLGSTDIVQLLLESERCDVNQVTKREGNSALHLAALGGSVEAIEMLIKHGASPNAINQRLKTPLHFAARVDLESTEALLRSGANPNAEDAEQRTALHAAVAQSEVRFGMEISKLLLSWSANVNKQDRYGYTALHIAALNELPDCAEELIRYGADVSARTRGGSTALGILARKTPSALSAIRGLLDSYITCNDDMSYRQVRLTFNFKYLLQGAERCEMDFLKTLVAEGQRGLLEHPLCEAFLHLKWQRIRKYYLARLLFCLFFVVLLSIYVLLVLSYQCYKKVEKIDDEIQDKGGWGTRNLPDFEFDATLCENKTSMGRWLRRHPNVVEIEWLLLAIVTFLEVLRKIYGINGYKSIKEYITASNIVEWFVILGVVATSYLLLPGPTRLWQNHVGAFAVLAGWANLMVMIGRLPCFGSYVTMYVKVQKEFAKLLSAYICLLIGFTICFCAIFLNADAFENPLVGFVKILAMMTGEFELGDLLKDIQKESAQPSGGLLKDDLKRSIQAPGSLLEASALITFVLFLLFVTVILINLLIGIAVHDIQGLQKTAGLSKLVGMTNLISHIEAALHSKRVPNVWMKFLSSRSKITSLLTVNPLSPRENRLPLEILRSGLDVARQGRGKKSAEHKRIAFSSKRKETIGEYPNFDVLEAIMKLSEEIQELKKLINEKNEAI